LAHVPITRRALFAIPSALSLTDASADLIPLAPGSALLRHGSEREGMIVPALRARIATHVVLAGHALVATAFGADPDRDTTVDLLALTSHEPGRPPRLRALELIAYADADGFRMSTRFSAAGDGSRLIFARTASAARGATLVTRAAWIDYLAWSDGAALADRPIHPPPPGSCAALLAQRRVRVGVALSGMVAEISPALLRDTGLLQRLSPRLPIKS